MPLMHSYRLVILSTLLVTPLYHHPDVPCYVAPFSAAPRPFHTCVTKIGLIDPDNLTKEEPQTLMWTKASQAPWLEYWTHWRNWSDCLWVWLIGTTNVEVTLVWNTSDGLEGLKAARHVIPHVPDNRSLLPVRSYTRCVEGHDEGEEQSVLMGSNTTIY